jgi:hypothetical protein
MYSYQCLTEQFVDISRNLICERAFQITFRPQPVQNVVFFSLLHGCTARVCALPASESSRAPNSYSRILRRLIPHHMRAAGNSKTDLLNRLALWPKKTHDLYETFSIPIYSIYSCLVGVIGSLVMMFVISVMYSAVCLAACLLFIILFNFTSQPRYSEWGSIGQALIFHQVRKYLLLMDVRKDHVKFWRPQILLMISNPKYNCALIDFINALKKSGLYILGHVYVADFDQLEVKDPSLTELPDWLSLIDHLKVKAFPEITVAKSVREGVCQLARISGIKIHNALKALSNEIGSQSRIYLE